MTNINAFIPERLVEAREARGMTITQLADLVGVSKAAVSQYEHGLHAPRPDTVEKLADRLNLPEHFFYRPAENGAPNAIFFRSFSSLTKRDRGRSARRLVWLQNLTRFLEEYIEFAPVKVPDLDIGPNPASASLDTIEEIAGEARRFYGLGNGPITNMTLLLENHGFLISHQEFEADVMDADSTVGQDGRPFITLNPRMAARQRFNLAHELGHIVMHRSIQPEPQNIKTLEEQAHRFASAFLLPARSYLTEFAVASLEVFKSLKLRWGVSIAAQLHRCQSLGAVSESRATLLWKKISRLGWRKLEPLDMELAATEKPKFLADSVRLLIDSGIMTKEQVRDAMALSGSDIVSLACLEEGFFDDGRKESPAMPRLKGDQRSKVIPFRKIS